MRYLLILSLFIIGCSENPKLREGSCYEVYLYDNSTIGEIHIVSLYKVVKIFTWKKHKHYAIQVLDPQKNIGPLYPNIKSYGYVRVDRFDKYMAPISSLIAPGDPENSPIKCNEILQADRDDKSIPPLTIVGDE